MNKIKQLLVTDWGFMRILRLGLGIFIGYQAVTTHDALSGMIAAFFLFQAVTNTGCCGSQSCSTAPAKDDADNTEEVVFEEIKIENRK